jgi:hypothetical protein
MRPTVRREDDAITRNKRAELVRLVDLVQILIQAGCSPEQFQAFVRCFWTKQAGAR